MSERVDLEQLEALERAATPGPWRCYPNPMRSDGVFVCKEGPLPRYSNGEPEATPRGWGISSQITIPEANLIAAMRNALPDLIAELRTARLEAKEADEERAVAMAMRNNERARIVAYVRALSGRSETDDSWNGEQCHGIANAIERGEHMR